MATEPPPFVTFKAKDAKDEFKYLDRVPVYQLALDLSKQLFTIVEVTEGVERFYLRDTLDKKSTAVPMLVARGLSTSDMSERRDLYKKARRAISDCAAILDVVAARGTAEEELVINARATVTALGAQLDALTQPPPKQY